MKEVFDPVEITVDNIPIHYYYILCRNLEWADIIYCLLSIGRKFAVIRSLINCNTVLLVEIGVGCINSQLQSLCALIPLIEQNLKKKLEHQSPIPLYYSINKLTKRKNNNQKKT